MEQIYLGITPYDENGSFEFAGRNEETWALYDRIIRNEYTVYYAASGEGKSSLIRAGLLPILRRRNFFPIYIVFEDKQLEDLSSIEKFINDKIQIEADKHHVTYEQSAWSKSRFDVEQSEALTNNLWWKLRNYCFKHEDIELKPLFIFDQFEEVFTKASYEWTDHFFAWLEEISTDYLPDSLRKLTNSWGIDVPTQKNFKALFSFRTEYLGDLDYWCVQKHFLPSLQENRMCLKPLTPKGAREIINLNESSLGIYTDEIIQGCTEARTNTKKEDQPCVYALILSVVCQTLSEISDKERVELLVKLKNNQDDTIDDILLRFYKKKLKTVGLNYYKEEKIITEIENALIDENGKRRRRDTNEINMQPLSRWIGQLCNKDCGLLKIIGKKKIDGQTINTVEFPHDRLCKAIDASRKERQKKIVWRLYRQKEWMQFGIITAIVGIIAFLWNNMMPAIKPIIHYILNLDYSFIEHIKEPKKFFNCFKEFIQAIHTALIKYLKDDISNVIDEGCSTILLMVTLLLFVPLLSILITSKKKKWSILSTIISFISTSTLCFLLYRNRNIEFADNYVPTITIIAFIASTFVLIKSCLEIKGSFNMLHVKTSDTEQASLWPLWGGYFIFSIYAFYEFLCRTTFGINEPVDSFWALFVIPMLYTMWAKGFFNMTIDKNAKIKILYTISIFVLILLSVLSAVSDCNSIKRSYGFTSSIILIILCFAIFSCIIWRSKSNTHYYSLTKWKRLFIMISGSLIIVSVFLLNLGYNPISISPASAYQVYSWRTVIISQNDSSGDKKFGILYATNGKTIIPCYTPSDQENKPLIGTIEASFMNSPFEEDAVDANTDNSLRWDSLHRKITATIPTTPTLEQYLHCKFNSGLPANSKLTDSIDYYAALLFNEIREANINYVTKGKSYNLDVLPSIDILDNLQHTALSNELKKFSDTTKISRGRTIVSRPRIEVLEDKDLIDFYRELSRSFLLCIIKDRAIQSDMPTMFTLSHTYLLTFFTSVPAMDMQFSYHNSSNFHFNYKVNVQDKNIQKSDTIKQEIRHTILSDDILNQRPFAWYNLFNVLCATDMAYNSKTLQNTWKNYTQQVEQHIKEIEQQEEAKKELLELRPLLLTTNIKDTKTLEEALSIMKDYIEKQQKLRNPQTYSSILNILEQDIPYIKAYPAEQSLKRLKEEVCDTLISIINKKETGIYNNAFESIYRNLVLVSFFRGNNIQDDIKKLLQYTKDKNQIIYQAQEMNSIINIANSTFHKYNQNKVEIVEQLHETIEQVKANEIIQNNTH